MIFLNKEILLTEQLLIFTIHIYILRLHETHEVSYHSLLMFNLFLQSNLLT